MRVPNADLEGERSSLYTRFMEGHVLGYLEVCQTRRIGESPIAGFNVRFSQLRVSGVRHECTCASAAAGSKRTSTGERHIDDAGGSLAGHKLG